MRLLTVAMWCLMAMVAVACSSAPTEVSVGDTEQAADADTEPADTSTLAVASDSPPIELTSEDLPGVLSLVECAWVAPHQFRVAVQWEPDTDAEPVDVDLSATLYRGDMGSGGGRTAFTLANAERLSFAVETPIRTDEPGVSGERWIYDADIENNCVIGVNGDDLWSDAVPVARRPLPPGGDPAATELDEFIDSLPLATDDRLVPLAYFRAGGGLEQIDELAILEDRILRDIRLRREGTCTTVTSTYLQPEMRVVQSYGCAEPNANETSPGGNWVLAGADGESVRWLTVMGGAVPEPSDIIFDPDRWFDTFFNTEPMRTELGRFDWEGLRIAIWAYDTQKPDGHTQIEATFAPDLGDRFGMGGGFSGTTCDEYQILDAGFGRPLEAGFLFVLSPDPNIEFFAYEGPDGLIDPPDRLDIELIPAALDGYYVGFLDLRDGGYEWNTWIRPADTNGQFIGCTQ